MPLIIVGVLIEFGVGGLMIAHPPSVLQETEGVILLGFALLTLAVVIGSMEIVVAIGRRK